MSESNEEKPGIKVNDKRRFTGEGEENSAAAPLPEVEESAAPDEAEAQAPHAEHSEFDIKAEFSSFILSLAAGAQSALGIAPNPMTGKVEKNLLQAKHIIDLLEILEAKTKGNLTPEEAQLLQVLLYELRLRFVEAKKES